MPLMGNNEKKIMAYNKKWKKIKNKLNEKSYSHWFIQGEGMGGEGGGRTSLSWNICCFCFLLLLIYLVFFSVFCMGLCCKFLWLICNFIFVLFN